MKAIVNNVVNNDISCSSVFLLPFLVLSPYSPAELDQPGVEKPHRLLFCFLISGEPFELTIDNTLMSLNLWTGQIGRGIRSHCWSCAANQGNQKWARPLIVSHICELSWKTAVINRVKSPIAIAWSHFQMSKKKLLIRLFSNLYDNVSKVLLLNKREKKEDVGNSSFVKHVGNSNKSYLSLVFFF